jgi:hypothetical protein
MKAVTRTSRTPAKTSVNSRTPILTLIAALAAGCGGSSTPSSQPSQPSADVGCEPAATAAARAFVDSARDTSLADATDDHVAAAFEHVGAKLAAACAETAWSAEVRACMAAVTSVDSLKACTGGFAAPQTEAYGTALLEGLDAAAAASAP